MKLIVILGLAATVGFLAGCETFFPESTDAEESARLEEYGGYTTEDEAPGFGDAELVSGYPDEEPFDDEIADHPEVVRTTRHERARHYALRIVWGNLDRPDTTVGIGEDCPVSDWSGSVTVDGGVIIVRRLIRFEPGDSVVRPRSKPGDVEWVSYTKDHVDGIVVHIIDVPDPTAAEAQSAVTITTALYSAEIPFRDLEDYREFVTYDDCNKISVVATEITPSHCPRGFLEGLWIAETDTSGHLKGVWISSRGDFIGHLKARYTIRDGRRVLFGKLIGRNGRFEALLKGTWTPMESEPGPDGCFEGRWVDKDLIVRGFFKGHYCFCDDGEGFFHGRWVGVCR